MPFLSTDFMYLDWFTGPISIDTGAATHTLGVTKAGDAVVVQLVHATGAVTQTTLDTAVQVDDHVPCALVERSDGKLIAFWTAHSAGIGMDYAISTNAGDSTAWGTKQTLGSVRYTYAHVFRLTGEGTGSGRIYLFTRDTENASAKKIVYFYSDNDGATWTGPRDLITATVGDDYPYTIFGSNGVDRIDFVCSIIDASTGPLEDRLHVFHGYFQAEEVFDSAGISKGSQAGGTFPITIESDLTQVYDSSTGDEAWVWDVITNGGSPAILWSTFPTVGTDHDYYESRWGGSAWATPTKVADAGGTPVNTALSEEVHYSCGVSFDGDNPDAVYAAIGANTGGSRIVRMVKSAGVWSEVESIYGKDDFTLQNLRPIVPYTTGTVSDRCRVIWLSGHYQHFTNYDTCLMYQVKKTALMGGLGWSKVADMTVAGAQVTGGPHGDFTAVVTNAGLPSDFFANVQADGGDIRFSMSRESAGTGQYHAVHTLPCEIAFIDTATSKLEVWVTLPELQAGGTDTTISIWYGGTGKAQGAGLLGHDSDGFPPVQAAWHPKVFASVLHCNDASGGLADSSHNGNDFGTVNGTPLFAQTGAWGGASAVDMNNDSSSFDIGARVGLYVELWANHRGANTAGESWYVGYGSSTDNPKYGYIIEDKAGTPQRVRAGHFIVSNPVAQDTAVGAGWKYIYASPVADIMVQVNNRTPNMVANTTSYSLWNRIRIGGVNRLDPFVVCDALIDEIRFFRDSLRRGGRSSDYRDTEYLNGNAPGTFWVPGASEDLVTQGSLLSAEIAWAVVSAPTQTLTQVIAWSIQALTAQPVAWAIKRQSARAIAWAIDSENELLSQAIAWEIQETAGPTDQTLAQAIAWRIGVRWFKRTR